MAGGAGLDEARACSREEAMPEDDDDEEELLSSQSHEAEGVEGQCQIPAAWGSGPLHLLPAGQDTP